MLVVRRIVVARPVPVVVRRRIVVLSPVARKRKPRSSVAAFVFLGGWSWLVLSGHNPVDWVIRLLQILGQ